LIGFPCGVELKMRRSNSFIRYHEVIVGLEDLPPLVSHFVAKFSNRVSADGPGYPDAGRRKLASYTWPGNVRELENSIERAMILAHGEAIDATHLDFGRRAHHSTGPMPAVTAAPAPAAPASSGPVAAFDSAGDDARPLAERLLDQERQEIIAAVEKSNSNIAGAARMLGINRSTLYYRMRKHGLEHLLPTKVVPAKPAPTKHSAPEPSS